MSGTEKLPLMGAIGLFPPPVQLRCSAHNESMLDFLNFDVPVELGLDLTTTFSSDFPDAEWENFDDVIDKVDSLCLFYSCHAYNMLRH
jgi:hypothetical protein